MGMEGGARASTPCHNEAKVTDAHGALAGQAPPFHNNVVTWCSSSQGAVCIKANVAMTCGGLLCPADGAGSKDLLSRRGKLLK